MRGWLGVLGAVALAGCAPIEADFTVRPGVETATVLDGRPGGAYTLYDAEGEALLTLIADEAGQAHFAYLPPEYAVVETGPDKRFAFGDGTTLAPGEDYEIVNDATGERSGPFAVLGVHDAGPGTPYADQVLTGVTFSPIDGLRGDAEDGFQYLEMRDGVLLSAMVRFPDRLIYGDGPWPTVIEYSGYSPSNPARPDSGTQIANAMGFATVSVNMRGSGCSGGVFDVFNPAQHADGYDVVEIVAAQDWVLNHQVGMVGLSYPGISQLFVANTNPPHLAAVAPLSTIADPWEMQWPGGIYNGGFTRQWVEERESQAAQGGIGWVNQRIEGGDTTCADNVKLSSQNIDFESFLRALEMRPEHADDRDLRKLIEEIEAPVFLGGQFQDEQTGAQFGDMLDRFDRSAHTRFVLANGRHPDGYSPDNVFRWFEFLEFHVAERIPQVNGAIRLVGASEIGKTFGMDGYRFPDDRFAEYTSYDEALDAYMSEPRFTILFENGAGDAIPGSPTPTFTTQVDAWPPPGNGRLTFALDADGVLTGDQATAEGVDTWTFDPEAGSTTFFGPRGYELLVPLWDIAWTRFGEDEAARFDTPAFTEDTVVAGPGIAELWIRSPEDDVTVQVTLTELRPDGVEVYVQSGWLRLGHRAAERTDDLRLIRSYAADDFAPVPTGEWVQADLALPSFAHPVRAGSRLRMSVSTPGRDHGTWEFETPAYDGTPVFEVGFGGDHASKLLLQTMPGLEIPGDLPPCPSLRGQPCRAWQE